MLNNLSERDSLIIGVAAAAACVGIVVWSRTRPKAIPVPERKTRRAKKPSAR